MYVNITLNPTQYRSVGSKNFIYLRTLDETNEEVYNAIYYKEVLSLQETWTKC